MTKRTVVAFTDRAGNLEWGYLLSLRGDGGGFVEWQGRVVETAEVLPPFPLPSVNLRAGAVLDPWTAGMERAVLSNQAKPWHGPGH